MYNKDLYAAFAELWAKVVEFTKGAFDTLKEIVDNKVEALNESIDTKLDKVSPTGSGALSINRKASTTVGTDSVAIGLDNTASGYASAAIGQSNTASGAQSVALGHSNTTTGYASVAIGNNNTASGSGSKSLGRYTIANGTAQTALGKYNVADSTNLLIVGNGTSNTVRSNAFTLADNGDTWFAGDVYVGSTSGTNKDSGSKKLATMDDLASIDVDGYLPLTAGQDYKLTGALGLTEGVMYGTELPDSGFEGQLYFVADEDADDVALPTGGTAGQFLIKNSSTDGDASWKTIQYLEKNPASIEIIGATVPFIDFHYSGSTADYTSRIAEYSSGTITIATNLTVPGTITGNKVYGAVWNDYAEFRICNGEFAPGRVVCENGDDALSVATERLQPGANIVSDTYGFAIGETDEAKCPIAVSGRVLAYTYEDRNEFQPGEAVCAGPNGTVSRMTREEIREYPERIIGTVSAVPTYETWGEDNIPVNGRIWIRVK